MNQNYLSGMTVNERLFYFNLLEKFDSCIDSNNRELAIETLCEAQLSLEQAIETVSQIFENPKAYGY